MSTDAVQKIITAYARDLEGLTLDECADVGFDDVQCEALVQALGKGADGIVTPEERVVLAAAGFSRDFIQGIAGSDGKKALYERVKWLGDNCVTRWYRFDYDWRMRTDMVSELKNIGVDAEAAVPALIEALKDKNGGIRGEAALALGIIGPAASPAVAALIAAMKEEYYSVREGAIKAIERIGPAARAAVPALIEALGNKYISTRIDAAQALGAIGPDAAAAVPALIKALKDRELYNAAARALGAIGPDAAAAIPILIGGTIEVCISVAGCHDRVPSVLCQIGAPAVPALIEELKKGSRKAAEAIGCIGPAARSAIPALIALKSEDPELRREIIYALSKIESETSVTAPYFIKALTDGDERVRSAAAIALAHIGPDAYMAIPALLKALKDHDSDVRIMVAAALSNICDTIGGLVAFMDADMADDQICDGVAFAISQMETNGYLALPWLSGLAVNSPHASCRESAKTAVDAIIERVE